MSKDNDEELSRHIGHKISVLKTQGTILEIKCLTCNKILEYNVDSVEEIENIGEGRNE